MASPELPWGFSEVIQVAGQINAIRSATEDSAISARKVDDGTMRNLCEPAGRPSRYSFADPMPANQTHTELAGQRIIGAARKLTSSGGDRHYPRKATFR